MNYNKNNTLNYGLQLRSANKTATLLLNSFFNSKNALINTPVFLINHAFSNKQVTVQLSYYLASGIPPHKGGFSNHTLKSLLNALTQVYGSHNLPVNVQLDLVRQYQPYMNADILAQYLAINLSTQGFSRVLNLLLNAVPYLNPNYAFGQSCITGVKVQLSGLLTSQRNRSRKSVYTASAGTFHKSHMYSNVNAANSVIVDYSSYTSKSGLGAFTVKVWIAATSPESRQE